MGRGVVAPAQSAVPGPASPHVTWSEWNVSRTEREAQAGHSGLVVWLTGLSGAGKSTVARAVERLLFDAGRRTILLDGDQLRHGLTRDLGFSPADRAENMRRAAEVARLFLESGHVVLCAFVSPYARDREMVRSLVGATDFVEVHVTAALDTLHARDPKGLYARDAQRGDVGLSGVRTPYEEPLTPDLRLDTDALSVDEAVAALRTLIETRLERR
jgi:bifunctional enzyme CysN/CysC